MCWPPLVRVRVLIHEPTLAKQTGHAELELARVQTQDSLGCAHGIAKLDALRGPSVPPLLLHYLRINNTFVPFPPAVRSVPVYFVLSPIGIIFLQA